jgi:uncharacterized protein (TIGR02594 family)
MFAGFVEATRRSGYQAVDGATFKNLVTNRNAWLTKEADADPAFREYAQNFFMSDIQSTITLIRRNLTPGTSLSYQGGRFTIIQESVELPSDFRMGGKTAVETAAERQVGGFTVDDLNGKLNALKTLKGFGKEITDAVIEMELGAPPPGRVGGQGNDSLEGSAGEDFLLSDFEGVAPSALINTAKSVLGMNEKAQKDTLAKFLAKGGINIDPSKTAWCAAFVNATLQENGLSGTGALNARSFLNWGSEVKTPKLGDVVVFSRGSDPNAGHVGFFKGFDENGDILVLGGNQSDSVNIQSYSKDRLLGFRRPPGARNVGSEESIAGTIQNLAEGSITVPDMSAILPDVSSQEVGSGSPQEARTAAFDLPGTTPTQEAPTAATGPSPETVGRIRELLAAKTVDPEIKALIEALIGGKNA